MANGNGNTPQSSANTDQKTPFPAWLSGMWSTAIETGKTGIIVDWFVAWFFGMGLASIALAALAAVVMGPDGIGEQTRLANLQLQLEVKFELKDTTPKEKTGPATPSNAAAKPVAKDDGCACAGSSGHWGVGLRVLALGLLMAAACGVIGWLFGLLFGVPRAVAQATDANAEAALDAAKQTPTTVRRTTTTRVNTNLEDISDWLTKTLIGVGIAGLYSIPKFLGDTAFAANRFGFAWGDSGQLLALAIILYFVPGGFWLGYVNTRTALTQLFDMFGGNWQAQVGTAAAVDNLEIDGLNNIREAKGAVLVADAAILSKPLAALRKQRRGHRLGAAAMARALAEHPPHAPTQSRSRAGRPGERGVRQRTRQRRGTQAACKDLHRQGQDLGWRPNSRARSPIRNMALHASWYPL